MDKNISFDTLPAAVYEMNKRLQRIETILNTAKFEQESETWFDLDALTKYLPDHPAKQTIYGMVSRREIPFNKRGKRLIFSKNDIDSWLQQTRQKTINEIRREI